MIGIFQNCNSQISTEKELPGIVGFARTPDASANRSTTAVDKGVRKCARIKIERKPRHASRESKTEAVDPGSARAAIGFESRLGKPALSPVDQARQVFGVCGKEWSSNDRLQKKGAVPVKEPVFSQLYRTALRSRLEFPGRCAALLREPTGA